MFNLFVSYSKYMDASRKFVMSFLKNGILDKATGSYIQEESGRFFVTFAYEGVEDWIIPPKTKFHEVSTFFGNGNETIFVSIHFEYRWIVLEGNYGPLRKFLAQFNINLDEYEME